MLIGVCGVSGSGKTVFMTCVFQTAGEVISTDGKITASSDQNEGALYFRTVEQVIRNEGAPTGTRENALASFSIDLRAPIPGIESSEIPIYLFDFAGGNFELLADRKSFSVQSLPTSTKSQLEEVHRFLEQCDGLIILISSTLFGDSQIAEKTIPFPKIIDNLLDRSVRAHRPVALVFTQVDNNPRLTEELLATFPTVSRFRIRFTDDLDSKNRPFGIVRVLTCYEMDRGTNLPRKQDAEGGIWRREPLDTFLIIVKAAWNQTVARLRADAEAKALEARHQAQYEEQKHLTLIKLQEESVRRWRSRLALQIMVVILIAAIALTLPSLISRRSRNQELSHAEAALKEVSAALHVPSASPADGPSIDRLRSLYPILEKEAPGELEEFWKDYQVRLAEFVAEPVSPSQGYASKLKAYVDLAKFLAKPPVWLEETGRRLDARSEFLASWPSKAGPQEKQADTRRQFLQATKTQAATLHDEPFLAYIQDLSVQEGNGALAAWGEQIALKSTLSERLVLIGTFLPQVPRMGDADFDREARASLAAWTIRSVVELEDKGHFAKILETALPGTAEKFAGYKIPYKVVYDRVTASLGPEVASLDQGVASAADEYRTSTENHMYAVESLLSRIFAEARPADTLVIARRLLQAVREDYLLDLSPDAWPTGVRPMLWDLESMTAEGGAAFNWKTVVDALALEPIYTRETQGLRELIHSHNSTQP